MASEYETTGRLGGINRNLGSMSWATSSTTTTSMKLYTGLPSIPQTGDVTGSSPYVCQYDPHSRVSVLHSPVYGDKHWGVNQSSYSRKGQLVTDNCIFCGARIVNRYFTATALWDGWRPVASSPPTCIIEEIPW